MATEFSYNQPFQWEAVWDFDVDGGTAGAFDLGDLPLGAVVTEARGIVETAVDSAADGVTMILGTTDDTNGFIASVAEDVTGVKYSVVGGDIAATQPQCNDANSRDVVRTIGGENATVGKVRFVLCGFLPSSINDLTAA